MTAEDVDPVLEFLLSDHPAAKAERERRRRAHYAQRTVDTDAIAAWCARIDVLGERAPAHLRDLAATMDRIASRSALRDAVDEVEPDDLWVARERQRLEVAVRASGTHPAYRYPTRYLSPEAFDSPICWSTNRTWKGLALSSEQIGSGRFEMLWNVEQTATFLGVPVATLYQWRYHRKGPRAYRVGKWLRYDPQDVRRWLAEQAT